MLELKNVTVCVKDGIFSFNKHILVQDICFSLCRGRSLGIIGKSGSGKTTIANVILGMLPLNVGKISIDGMELSSYRKKERARKIQLITQNPETSFDPDLTIKESFLEIIRVHNLMKKTVLFESFVFPFLNDMGFEDKNLDTYPDRFSGGELQRLSIVRSLLLSPEFIIFDEADSMLDTSLRIKLFGLLKTLKEKYNLGYIYITHDIRVLPHIADDVLVIKKGRTEAFGPVSILKTSKNHYIKELRSAIFMPNIYKFGK